METHCTISGLSLIIPTYQERENLTPLLDRLERVRARLGDPLEVLIVDSGSPDGTGHLAAELLARSGLGRVIAIRPRGDVVEAVVQGIRSATGDLIGVMDADLSHPPELLPELVTAVREGADIAVASRYVPGGGIEGWPWRRRLLSACGRLLARPLVRVADPLSGYFVCRAPVASRVALRPRGFKVLLELLVQGRLRNIREVPYVFRDRLHGSSKLTPGVMWAYLAQLWGLYRLRGGAWRASSAISSS